MANSDINLAERSGSLVESHKGYDPRIIFFYFVLAALLIALVAGLAYQQLIKTSDHAIAERQQNQRRIIFPGPRGNIYDRNGQMLVGNNHQFTVRLYLDELRRELATEFIRIRNNYRETGDKDIPDATQLRKIARVSVVQRYLDQINTITGRQEKVNARKLEQHFFQRLLLPYTLIEDLKPEEYARLLEGLPVRSPLELYPSTVRSYPFGAAAAHTLGYVREEAAVAAEGFPGEDLPGQFKEKAAVGMNGLEKAFDSFLQGEPGGRIVLVDPSGFKISKPLEERKPKQGKHLVTSLDIDLQMEAERTIGDQTGAAVAIDVNTGEVLVLASMPNYDLNLWYPHMPTEAYRAIQEKGAERNNAINGFFPPGSTFKIVTTIAGLRSHALDPDQPIIECKGVIYLGRQAFVCFNRRGIHGDVLLREAIAKSCDVYFYEAGARITPTVIAAEGRRFHLDRPTGIELPSEGKRSIMPDPEWKKKNRNEPWVGGDTYQMAIGQGLVLVSPLQMACFVASVARNEVWTQPTLIHRPDAPQLRAEPIGLTPDQRIALLEGMAGTVRYGTASTKLGPKGPFRVDGVTLAGKTGTAQLEVRQDGKKGKINLAWFICFAPVEKPEIAMAVMIEGEEIGEQLAGGDAAAPVAAAVLRKYFAKKNAAATRVAAPVFKMK
jgi:penicillin-binding protein 2